MKRKSRPKPEIRLSEREQGVGEQDHDDNRYGYSDDGPRANLDSLVILGVEVPHEACGGLESRVVFLCHGTAFGDAYIIFFRGMTIECRPAQSSDTENVFYKR